MLKKVLWLALACGVLLAALAASRHVRFTGEPEKAAAPAAEDAAKPAAAKAPEKPAEEKPPLTPEELQMQEDAAATGMTTVEPAPSDPQPEPSQRPAERPPT